MSARCFEPVCSCRCHDSERDREPRQCGERIKGARCVRAVGHAGKCVPYRSLERCGAWMPLARERCYRTKGHGDAHRTQWAMLCDARRRRANSWITDFQTDDATPTMQLHAAK